MASDQFQFPHSGSGLFGLDTTYESSKLIVLPAPWDATTSGGQGACNGPQVVLSQSTELDLFDPDFGTAAMDGIHFWDVDQEEIKNLNQKAQEHAFLWREVYPTQILPDLKNESLKIVNESSERFNQWVYEKSKTILDDGKILGLLGGDHSVPYGAYRALCEKQKSFGILHIDAHFDLRDSYEGFHHSHASIFHNALKDFPQMEKLVQVGLRDFCQREWEVAQNNEGRLIHFTDRAMKKSLYDGDSWNSICKKIIDPLPENIWISLDVDGLDPRFFPNTGTPVAGGLEFSQMENLLHTISKLGKKVIGFDLVEVSSGPECAWDGNCGARLLYQLSTSALFAARG